MHRRHEFSCGKQSVAVQDEEEEPDQVKYHMSQLRKLTRQYPASRLVWKELCGLICQQGSGYTVTDARTCCVDAVRALSKHAERLRITTASNGAAAGSEPAAASGEVWQAECAAVEALVRQIELELCSGHISEALMLLRCACEWSSCPRESCTSLLSRLASIVYPHTALNIPNRQQGVDASHCMSMTDYMYVNRVTI